MNFLAIRLLTTFITALLIYLMGWLSAHVPLWVSALATDMLGQAGGVTVVATALAGTVAVFGFALYQRIKLFVETQLALKLPPSATHSDVKRAYGKMSYKEIITVDIPQASLVRRMAGVTR